MRSNYTKFQFTFSILLVSMFIFSGCSYFFDKKEKENEARFSSEHADCLVGSMDVLVNYFDDFSERERAESDVVELGLCYNKAIDSFVKFTTSGEEDSEEYTAEKFENFFEKFYPEMGMTISKIKGYIEFKHFFVGGSKATVSKDELLAIAKVLPDVSHAMAELAPYRDILMGDASLEPSEEGKERFYEAFSSLKTIAGQLIHSFKPWASERSANLTSLGSFVVDEYYSETSEDKMPIVEMLISFKNLSLNERHEFLKREDLSSFVIQTIRTYEAISEFNYFVKDENFFDSLGTIVTFIVKIPSQLLHSKKFQGETLSSLINIVGISGEVLSRSAKRSDSGLISVDKISDLIMSMEKAEFLTGSLRASTLSYFIEQFSKKWLITSKKKIGGDIDREKINYISSAVQDWGERQSFINERFGSRDATSLIEVRKDVKNEQIKKWLSIYEKTALHQWLPDGRVKYSSNASDLSYEELTVSNSLYSLVNIFMKPFSVGTKDPLLYKVKKSEAQEVYNVLRILGIDMAFVDARVLNSGENSFSEGNNFTTQKRSNKILDFYEAYELMSVNFASGILAKKIHKGFSETADSECLLEHTDVFRKRVMRSDCFMEHMKVHFADYFSHLTSFMEYWGEASEKEKESFISSAELAFRGGTFSKKPFDMGELRVLSGTMYYMESIFHNFDRDNDGYIFSEEIFAARDHFQPLLIEFMVKNKPDVIESLEGRGGMTGMENLRKIVAPRIFMHLLRFGELPAENFAAKALLYYRPDMAYEQWTKTPYEGKVKFDRVIKVFAALGTTTGAGHRAKIANFLLENKEELFVNLATKEVPDCRVKKNLPFCTWARLIYCNEPVNDDLYEWMHLSQLLLFPDDAWKRDKENTVKEAMVDMSRFFRTHKVFSTQCAFPEVEPVKSYWDSFQDTVGSAKDKYWNDKKE